MLTNAQHPSLRKKNSANAGIDDVSMALQALVACTVVPSASPKEVVEDESDTDDDVLVSTKIPVFAKKLKGLVDDPEVDAVGWDASGESFIIHEPKRLAEQLEKYFKSSKLKSFVRQLHFYGFKKTGGSRNENWVYNHKNFQRDGKLMHKLRRKSCGPEQQLKSLRQKVDHLQGTLAATQQKLGNMAVALVQLLQNRERERQAAEKVNGVKKMRPPLSRNLNLRRIPSDPAPVVPTRTRPLKRRPSGDTKQNYESGQAGEGDILKGGARKLVRRNSDFAVGTAARRLPAPLSAYRDVFSQNMTLDGLTPTGFDLDDFDSEDFLMAPSPMRDDSHINLSTDLDMRLSFVSATA